jgi:pimeloyl-ACP methyl ester carboxylesterase
MHPIVQKWLPRIIGAQINTLSVFMPGRASQKAFYLFCTPRRGRLRPKDEQYLATAQRNLPIDTPHGKIQTYSWNESGKETVLLMHGWESNAARWRFLVAQLVEQNYRVVAMDAPAHGQLEGQLFHLPKYSESIHRVMQHYKADHLIGHSIGGMATTYYLSHYEHPAISSMIIMGAPSEFEKMLRKFSALLQLSNRSMKIIYRFLEEKFGHPPSYFSIKTFCRDLAVPAMIIHDEEDKIVPFQASQAYLSSLPNVSLMKTQKLGHSLQDESVFKAILRFFDEKEMVQ